MSQQPVVTTQWAYTPGLRMPQRNFEFLFDYHRDISYTSDSKPAGPLSKGMLTSAGLSFFAPVSWL